MNRSKNKGTSWESAIVTTLRANGFPGAERRALSGALDRGDIAGVIGWVIEAKAVKTYDIAGWLKEAEIERKNDGAEYGVVWAKSRGKTSPLDGFVVMNGATFLWLLRAVEL